MRMEKSEATKMVKLMVIYLGDFSEEKTSPKKTNPSTPLKTDRPWKRKLPLKMTTLGIYVRFLGSHAMLSELFPA